ncbi:MAG: hypothetical protein ABSG84_02465 [Acidobacteriaceae bacterium]|jgi:hypothetical protein
MNTEHQPDNAIDKTLAALNTAAPPEGLKARVAHRLAAQPAPAHLWRDRFPAAWWRGAATGAAFALLAVTAVLLLQHKTPPRSHIAVNLPTHAPTTTPVNAPESLTPCAQPAILRTHTPAASPATEIAASHSIPASPLTSQEREILRLAQTADPRALATLNPEHQAQLEAENAAQFEKFFTPPPPPPPPPDQPAANPAANPEANPANPEATPQANPEPDPPTNSDTNPAVNLNQ